MAEIGRFLAAINRVRLRCEYFVECAGGWSEVLDKGQQGRNGASYQLYLAGNHVQSSWRHATVGHMGDRRAGDSLELLQHQVVDATCARRTVVQGAGLLTGQVKQLFHVVGRQVVACCPDQWPRGDHGDRRKALQGVIAGRRQGGGNRGER